MCAGLRFACPLLALSMPPPNLASENHRKPSEIIGKLMAIIIAMFGLFMVKYIYLDNTFNCFFLFFDFSASDW